MARTKLQSTCSYIVFLWIVYSFIANHYLKKKEIWGPDQHSWFQVSFMVSAHFFLAKFLMPFIMQIPHLCNSYIKNECCGHSKLHPLWQVLVGWCCTMLWQHWPVLAWPVFPRGLCGEHPTMKHHYPAVGFLPDTSNAYGIGGPWGQAMRCV